MPARTAAPAVFDHLVDRKGASIVSACIPARDEVTTIAQVVNQVAVLRTAGLVDEILVIDDGSADATAYEADVAGATVILNTGPPGKGGALTTATRDAFGDILLFLDADVTTYTPVDLAALLAPLIDRQQVQLVKGRYRRPLAGEVDEGGRVTELLARPLLERFHPELACVNQPLAGESVVRRSALEGVTLAAGYGIEIGLLIDVYLHHGLGAIVEVDLATRTHRNRRLHDLRPHARDVLDAVLARTHLAAMGACVSRLST